MIPQIIPSGKPFTSMKIIFQGAGVIAKKNKPDQEIATSIRMILPLAIFFNSEMNRIP